jgi:hypothetical protein
MPPEFQKNLSTTKHKENTNTKFKKRSHVDIFREKEEKGKQRRFMTQTSW